MLPWNGEAVSRQSSAEMLTARLLEELRISLGAQAGVSDFSETPALDLALGQRPAKLRLWLHRGDQVQISLSIKADVTALLGAGPFELSIRAPVEQDWGWVGYWLRLVPSGLQLYSRDPQASPGKRQLDALEAALPAQLHALMTDPPAPLFESLKFHQGGFSFWPFSVRVESLHPQVLSCLARASQIVDAFEAA